VREIRVIKTGRDSLKLLDCSHHPGVWTRIVIPIACVIFPCVLAFAKSLLAHLKRQGRLVEALRSGVRGSRRALRVRPYAVRKPKQYAESGPGDLVRLTSCKNIKYDVAVFYQKRSSDIAVSDGASPCSVGGIVAEIRAFPY